MQVVQLEVEEDKKPLIPNSEINFSISRDSHLGHLIISLWVLTRTSNLSWQFIHRYSYIGIDLNKFIFKKSCFITENNPKLLKISI